MRKLALFLLAAVAVAQEPSPPSPATFQNVGSMSQLMIDIIYPTSNSIFYIEREAPKTQADWNNVQNQALMLAESGNLLMMPGRARDQGDWMKDARLLVDAGQAAFKLARAKDMPGILALNDQLYTSCVTCHEQYRPDYRRRREAQQKADEQKALKEKNAGDNTKDKK